MPKKPPKKKRKKRSSPVKKKGAGPKGHMPGGIQQVIVTSNPGLVDQEPESDGHSNRHRDTKTGQQDGHRTVGPLGTTAKTPAGQQES